MPGPVKTPLVVSALTTSLNIVDKCLGLFCNKPTFPFVNSVEIEEHHHPGEAQIRRSLSMVGKDWNHLLQEGDFSTMGELSQSVVKKYSSNKAMSWRPIKGTFQQSVPSKEGEKPRSFTVTELAPSVHVTFQEFGAKLQYVAFGLRSLGMKKGDIVALYEETRPEWFLLSHAAWADGFTVATVYANLGDEGMTYAVNQTESKVVFTNAKNVSTMLANPALEGYSTIVYTDSLPEKLTTEQLKGKTVLSFQELEDKGRKISETETMIFNMPNPEDLACIMYTSGTTGDPKGVMITHANMVAAILSFRQRMTVSMGPTGLSGRSYVAYLPLAHILELIAENIHFSGGALLGFGHPRTLTDQFAHPHGDIKEFKPTIFVGVPRVFDTIKKGAETKMQLASPLVRSLFNAAFEYKKIANGAGKDTPLWNKLIFDKFKDLFGGNVLQIFSGGAPLNAHSQEFMRVCFNCGVGQGYGLTETCAAVAVQHLADQANLSVGGVHSGIEIKLADIPDMGYYSTDKPCPRGEVLVRGPVVSKGYYKLPDKTAEAYLPGGWFATGDVGMWAEDGGLHLIDRKKNLVKLSMGEYVALEKLESFYANTPFVQPNGICCVADPDKSYIVAIILVSKDAVTNWMKKTGTKGEFSVLLESKELKKAIKDALDFEAKKAHLKHFEEVHDFRIFEDEWTPENGMVTAAMKLKRGNIAHRYADEIAEMYAEK